MTGNRARVDAQSFAMLKDGETAVHVDYVFIADLWGPDPRRTGRHMCIGQARGLLRFDTATCEAVLLHPMLADDGNHLYRKAAGRILQERRTSGAWPDRLRHAAG